MIDAAPPTETASVTTLEPTGEPSYPCDTDVIHECLKAYLHHRESSPTAGGWKFINFADYAPPTAAEEVAAVLKDSARLALRGRVRDIGVRLWFEGGTAKMREVMWRIDEMAATRRAVSVLDHWWDGIGNDRDRWIA